MSVDLGRRTFGQKLQAEFDKRPGYGARTLARALSQAHGGSIEDRRRAVIRWLRGGTPLTHNREMVEDALGLARDSLRGDDEDEEADPVAEIAFTQFLDALARRVEARIEKRERVA